MGFDMQNTETVMASALKAAGFVASNDRLRDIAIQAWAKFPKADQSPDRIAYVREKLAGEMTWHMMEQFSPFALRDAINALMRDTAELIAAQRDRNRTGRKADPTGGGQAAVNPHLRGAPATPIPPAQAGGRSEPASSVASSKDLTPAAPNSPGDIVPVRAHVRGKAGAPLSLKEMADRQQAAVAAKIATVARMSALDWVVINGQKVGDLTPAEASIWADKHAVLTRFVRVLISGLPADRPIRNFVTPDEADAMYASAERAEQAA